MKIKVSFLSLEENQPIITGGQIYDNDIYKILKEEKDIKLKTIALKSGWLRRTSLLSPFFFILKCKQLMKEDIIIINSAIFMWILPLLISLRMCGHKNVYTIHHHFLYQNLSGLKAKIYKPLEWLFLRSASKIIVPSPYILSLLQKKVSNEKLLHWRIPFFRDKLFEIDTVKGNLTFMGTIEPRKGVLYLLKAIKILKEKGVNHHLTIIGVPTDKKYYEEVKKYIKENSLDISFTGYLGREEKEKILSHTDIFVFPSLLEGFGMSLIEAQAYGIPIVTFNNSAMPYSVHHAINGFTVPNKDSFAFADAIMELLNNPNLRENLSKSALGNFNTQNTPESFRKTVKDYFKEFGISAIK